MTTTPEFDALFAESDPATQRVVLDCFDRPAPPVAAFFAKPNPLEVTA